MSGKAHHRGPIGGAGIVEPRTARQAELAEWATATCTQPDVDPDLWFSHPKDALGAAAAIAGCNACPVRDTLCTDRTLALMQRQGVWAGWRAGQLPRAQSHQNRVDSKGIRRHHGRHGEKDAVNAGCTCPPCAHTRAGLTPQESWEKLRAMVTDRAPVTDEP